MPVALIAALVIVAVYLSINKHEKANKRSMTIALPTNTIAVQRVQVNYTVPNDSTTNIEPINTFTVYRNQGTNYKVTIEQDAVGGHTMTWPTNIATPQLYGGGPSNSWPWTLITVLCATIFILSCFLFGLILYVLYASTRWKERPQST